MTAKVPEASDVGGGGQRPDPDPTLLTTASMLREVANLRREVDNRLDCMDEARTLERDHRHDGIMALQKVIETRLDGMDKAIQLLQGTADKFPGRIDEKIDALGGVMAEKFASIQTQFKERDVRGEQTARDTKVAVDAALQAAEKAVGKQNEASALSIAKSETMTVKQIDQQGQLITTNTKALDEKIDDVKDRLTRLEGRGEGGGVVAVERQTRARDMIGVIGLIVGALIGLAGLLMALRGGP